MQVFLSQLVLGHSVLGFLLLVVLSVSVEADDEADLAYMAQSSLNLKPETSCKPVLNISSLLQRPTVAAYEGDSKSIVDSQLKFSFPIGDIELPIGMKEGSINSAMRLLSAFGSQFDPSSSSEYTDSTFKFRDNRLHIGGLNLTMLNVHIYDKGEPRVALGFNIKNTTMTGRFLYNGALPIISESNIAGFYRMSIDNILLVVTSNLTRHNPELDYSSNLQSHLPLRTNDFRVNITNLGYIHIAISDTEDTSQPSTNYLLKMLQRILQRTIKRTYYTFETNIREALERESQRSLDCELSTYKPILMNSDNYQEFDPELDFGRIISSEMKRSQMDKMNLPDFSHQQNVLGTPSVIFFTNGSITGLSNVHLLGETRVKLQDQHLLINSSIGWTDLAPRYLWSLYLNAPNYSIEGKVAPTAKGFVSFNIKAVDFDAVIRRGLGPKAQVSVDELTIRRLENPKMDIGGLPGMNRVTRGLVNFFMGRMKQRLSGSIQPALRQQLEKSLNELNLFG